MTASTKNKPGRQGVTYEDVAKVAVELTVAGQNPSIRSIRSELGTGSESTIGTHLRAWREFEASKKQEDLEAGLSKELLAAIHSEITKHTNDAKAAIEENWVQVKSSTTELEGLLKNSEKKIEELKTIIYEKDAVIAKNRAEIEAESKAFNRLQGEMDQIRLKIQQERDFAIEMKTQNEFISQLNKKLEKDLTLEREKRLEFEVKIAKMGQK